MIAQQLSKPDITDEVSAKTYVDQSVMSTFCRALDQSRLPPDVVMRMLAAALGETYRQVMAAHVDGQCPCGWQPQPTDDIRGMVDALVNASAPRQLPDLRDMITAGHA